ncbi:MAG: glycoside hydrolase family 9 protein, partial [Muribaculaceae bacterium]|nr:glycoside hydrolase family 9 protein [Muribaculaceae bacterium]
DVQHIGDGVMRGIDFKNMAAAFLYNLTGDTKWEDDMANTSLSKTPNAHIWSTDKGMQTWATAAYLHTPHERHYTDIYNNMVDAVNRQAEELHLNKSQSRPSRRTTNDPRWQTSENLQLLMLAHSIASDPERKADLERAMILDADWCLGRNPSNTVEMTGLGQRHITDCYSTGRNDGMPGTHPGQTPFNGTETWSPGHNGGDARVLLAYCYPKWEDGWPSQESFFNQRYFWVNGEFTPRETMRGKMALLAYLHGIH